MKQWLWGIVTGIVLMFLLLFATGLLMWRLRGRGPEVRNNTVLVLNLHGDYPEQSPPDLTGQLLGTSGRTNFVSVIEDIQQAAENPRVSTILLEPSDLNIGWAKLEQLRESLEQFKSKGKKVLALLETGGSKEFFLSSVADQVYLSPVGVLDVKGMRIEVMFFKDTLAKLGAQADLEHIGRYKNFSDQFTENRMSDAFREAETALLDSIYGNFINTVAAARKRSPGELRVLIEQSGPFTAESAMQSGLVDGLKYEDQIFDEIKAQNAAHEAHRMVLEEYSKTTPSHTGGERIALVYAVGGITSGEDRFDPLQDGKTLGAKHMSKVLEDVGNDKSVKGVIVRIDSPGGDAFASDAIWRDLQSLRKKKPMVFSMSDTAASGGYYIAMTGDPVVAEPGTLTGSIGIVYGKLNLKGLYDKIGINKEIIARGKFSGMDSDYQAYTPEERDRVRVMMQDFYSKFVGKVAAARKMSPEAVDKIAQGRVWTGEQAKGNGLVDELGGLSKAIEMIKQKTGLRPDAKVELVEYPPRKSLFELLLSRAQWSEVRLPVFLSKALSAWKSIENFPSTFWLARMPFAMDIR